MNVSSPFTLGFLPSGYSCREISKEIAASGEAFLQTAKNEGYEWRNNGSESALLRCIAGLDQVCKKGNAMFIEHKTTDRPVETGSDHQSIADFARRYRLPKQEELRLIEKFGSTAPRHELLFAARREYQSFN